MRGKTVAGALISLAVALGCGGGGSSVPVNSVKIESVAASKDSQGTPVSFTITVSYDLRTADNGFISHAYLSNNSSEGSQYGWMGCPAPISDGTNDSGNAGVPVRRGHGTVEIPDAHALADAKEVCVLLIPDQDSKSTADMAVDVFTLPVL